MPRTKRGAIPKGINYNENSESDDECADMLTTLALMNYIASQRKTKKSAGRPRKNNCSEEVDEPCRCCKRKRPKPSPKRKITKKTVRNKRPVETAVSSAASTSQSLLVNLDSDEETKVEVTECQENAIKKKVGGFFEALGSDDEGKENKTVPLLPQQKTEDFYTLLSDEDLSTPVSDLTMKELTPASTDLDMPQPIEEENSSDVNKFDDILAYTEDVLNSCDDVIEVAEETETKAPMMSLEDLKKKTDEILNGVASCSDAFLSKNKESEATVPPVKESIICPVCLEPLGDAVQAMATVCGHMFCEPCLKGVIKTTRKCPSCRKGLTKAKYHPIYI